MDNLRQANWLGSGHYATTIDGEVFFRWDEEDKNPIQLDKTKYSWGEKINKQNCYYSVPIGKSSKTVHTIIARNYPDICGEWFDGCVVHHKNGLKYDNRATNLQVMSNEEHSAWHSKTKINYKGKDYCGFVSCTRDTGDDYCTIITDDSLVIYNSPNN